MPKHQQLRQVKAKSLSVKIPKNEPNTARLSWVLANEELLTGRNPSLCFGTLHGSSETSHRRSTTYLSGALAKPEKAHTRDDPRIRTTSGMPSGSHNR